MLSKGYRYLNPLRTIRILAIFMKITKLQMAITLKILVVRSYVLVPIDAELNVVSKFERIIKSWTHKYNTFSLGQIWPTMVLKGFNESRAVSSMKNFQILLKKQRRMIEYLFSLLDTVWHPTMVKNCIFCHKTQILIYYQ